MHERDLADSMRIFGSEHPRIMLARKGLAHAYASVGRLDEAIALHEHNQQEAHRLLGPEHPTTIDSRQDLAATYRSVGRHHDADRLADPSP